jgi:hypothetical protein
MSTSIELYVDDKVVGSGKSLPVRSVGFGSSVTLTRTADTAGYTGNDVIGVGSGAGLTTPGAAALTFSNIGPEAGEIKLIGASLTISSDGVISGETSYRLYLYNVTPPSALVDNAAFDLPSGDRAAFLGYIDLGTPLDIGLTLFVQTDTLAKQLTLASKNLYAYLVTNGPYTPTSGRVYVITLHSEAR